MSGERFGPGQTLGLSAANAGFAAKKTACAVAANGGREPNLIIRHNAANVGLDVSIAALSLKADGAVFLMLPSNWQRGIPANVICDEFLSGVSEERDNCLSS